MRTMSRLLGVLGLLCAIALILVSYAPIANAGICAYSSVCVGYCVDYCTQTVCRPVSNGWDCTGPYADLHRQCVWECEYPGCCI